MIQYVFIDIFILLTYSKICNMFSNKFPFPRHWTNLRFLSPWLYIEEVEFSCSAYF